MKHRLSDLLRSMPVRLALVLVALFTIVSLSSLGATYLITKRSFDQAMQADLTQDMAGFRAAPSAAALAQLVEAEAEATDPERMVLSYLAPNRRHFGNAMIAHDDDGYHILTGIPDNPRITGRYMALTASMHGGQLTIARNLSEIQTLGDVFLSVLGLSLIPTILIALSGGLFLARRSAERVRTINGTLERLTGGQLDARIGSTTGWPGDLSAIGRKVDTMAEAQEASVAAIRQVSSDIAHDLKTPIQRVAVYLNDLSDRDGLDVDAQELLDKAKAELDGIVGTFNALLQIAQIETGSPKSGFSDVDLSGLCTTFCELYGPAATDADHELTFQFPNADSIYVRGDKGLLGQVLANLIENAIRHTPAGSHISIAMEKKRGHVILSVADDGPGVPEGERELVLRRLYRMDRNRTSPGAGLGLSLVNSIAALHCAEIQLFDNEPGLRVEVRFPGPL
ncbi:MAG: HAMP domain-containing sensor histidine kinase [Roseovarius sp.]|nr:HAMP domain-containing sensor histidine kinase [Roseovarius sp.]